MAQLPTVIPGDPDHSPLHHNALHSLYNIVDAAPAGRIFYRGATTLASEAALTYDATNNRFHVGDYTALAVSATTGVLNLYGHAADADMFITRTVDAPGLGPQVIRIGLGGGASLYSNFVAGQGALSSITTGTGNTAIGYQALGGVTSGTNNTGMGTVAGGSVTTGSSNTAFGYHALLAVTTLDGNTALGSLAARDCTGNANTVVGAGAMWIATSAALNTCVGEQSLGSLTTGDTNTAIGEAAGYGVTTGAGNSFLGYNAGSGIAGSRINCVIIGGNDGSTISANGAILISDGSGAVRIMADTNGVVTVPGSFVALNGLASAESSGFLGVAYFQSTRNATGDSLFGAINATAAVNATIAVYSRGLQDLGIQVRSASTAGVKTLSLQAEGGTVNIAAAAGLIGFYGTTAVTQPAVVQYVNNITAGGTDNSPANWTDLSVYATDAAAIRNFAYQTARKIKQLQDALSNVASGVGLLNRT